MSTLNTTTTDDRTPGRGSKATKALAAVAAVAVLAFGANAIGKSGSSSTTGTPGAPGGIQNGTPPTDGAPPQMGADVTGTTLTRLKQVATAKYPGTVEHAQKLPDGSYVVHVIQSSGGGEVHVLVSKDFTVTGVDQGGPPSGQAAPRVSGGSPAAAS